MRLSPFFVVIALLQPWSAHGANSCIGVVGAGGRASFWQVVGEGAQAAGRELGVDVHYLLPGDENDRQEQAQLIRRVIELKCGALVLAPNAHERTQLIAQLRRQSVPTIFIDRSEPKAAPLSLIETDNYAAGRLAGEQIVRRLHGTGRRRVVLMRMQEGVQSTDERERGAADVLRQAGLTVVASPYLGASVIEARAAAEKALTPLAGQFDAVFMPNETTTDGTLQILDKLGLAGKVLAIGFDINQRLYDALRQRVIAALVLQRPFQMGYMGVTLAYRAMLGAKHVPKSVDSGVSLLTRDNMDQQDILYFSAYRSVAKP
ncbi:substrate-binding domain-containing protein [Paludibacterium purpuratum]|uniref:Monosaccharide ABC transporter substrate-binding protein (CUT2 family) n=1 Tax=Paludibacterium purpuratum TaxID=1144873 RepID=A0A4V3DUJ3_9NEIS|nr:substrate-binding domain-containing protein [Paludibacterium purpuratum]TDR73298.1 monosaccharide ABC transporter substrate-binding protein (CUT2 family) [Paludibacterium purpuratum]